MVRQKIDSSHFSADAQEFLELLDRYQVKYLIVGGEAVIYYGHVRLTGDLDIFYENSPDNAERLFRALKEFWDGDIPGVDSPEELRQQGTILQFGRPPNRIDLMTEIEGIRFGEAWATRKTVIMAAEGKTVPIHYIDLDHLIRNKENVKRPKDLEDLEYLYEARARGGR